MAKDDNIEPMVASLSYGMFGDEGSAVASMDYQHQAAAKAVLRALKEGSKTLAELAPLAPDVNMPTLLLNLNSDYLLRMNMIDTPENTNNRYAITVIGSEIIAEVDRKAAAGDKGIRLLGILTDEARSNGALYAENTSTNLLSDESNRWAVAALKLLGDNPVEIGELTRLTGVEASDAIGAAIQLDRDWLVELRNEGTATTVQITDKGKHLAAKIADLEKSGVADVKVGNVVDTLKQTGASAADWSSHAKDTKGWKHALE